MTVETINSASEFLFENDAPEILLNNLPSFNERTEDIVELSSYLDEYGTDKQKNYLPYFQYAIEFLEQNQRFPTLTELNEHCTSAPIPSRTETNVEDAYMVMGGDRISEEHLVSELRSAIRSKDVGRIADFAKSLQPSAPLPEINIDKILDIKAIRRKGRENYSPIITGIQVFDNLTYGFKNKTINTISAPSSGGKTTFAVNMAYNNAIKGNLVVYCALESSAEEILCSLISLAYKRKQKEDTSFLAEEFKPYKKIEGITGVYPGTVNSIKFYQLSEEIDDLLVVNYQSAITKNHGNIYVIDDSNGNLRSVQSFTAIIDAIAEKEGRKVDLVVVDNADELTSFEDGGKSDADMTMVNKMINQLNAYTTTHFNGQGTMILFLAQLNRTGITELAKDKPDLNLTHISTYSNLYTKAGVVAAISINKTKETVIDLRILKNRHGKKTGNEEPKHISALFEYSYIEGDNLNVEVTSKEETEDDIDDIAASMNTGMQDIDDISLEDDWDDDLTVG